VVFLLPALTVSSPPFEQTAEKPSKCHCEERFLRRGNLEAIDFFKTEIAEFIPSIKTEIASLRSQ